MIYGFVPMVFPDFLRLYGVDLHSSVPILCESGGMARGVSVRASGCRRSSSLAVSEIFMW